MPNMKAFREGLAAAVDGYIDEIDPDGAEMRELSRQVAKAEKEYNRPFARFNRWVRRTV